MKHFRVIVVGLALAVLLLVCLRGRCVPEGATPAAGARPTPSAARPAPPARPAGAPGQRNPGEGGGAPATNAAVADPYAAIERMQALLDVQDWPAALAEARRLLNHPDPVVRREVLFALHWIGEAAIVDLAHMMIDPDPDIADQARAYFGQALDNCDGQARRAAALALAMEAASARALDDLLPMLVGLQEQYAAPPLIKLLASRDPEIAGKAQESLQFLSGGEAFTNAAQWEDWCRQLPPPEPDPVIVTADVPASLFQHAAASNNAARVRRLLRAAAGATNAATRVRLPAPP